MFWKQVYRSTAPSPGEQHWKSTPSLRQNLSSSWRHWATEGKRDITACVTSSTPTHPPGGVGATLPCCRHSPARSAWICSSVWIPFPGDWPSLPGEPATGTPHPAGTWRRRAAAASGFCTASPRCRREGAPAGSWCRPWGTTTAAAASSSCFRARSSESRLPC